MATVGEIIRAAVLYDIANASEAQNVFTWVLTGGNETDANVVSYLSSWFTNSWGDKWADLASQDNNIVGLIIDVINADGTVKRSLGTETLAVQGTVAGTTDSAAVSGFMYNNTERPKTRGRKFVPGLADSVVQGGAIQPLPLADLALLAILWLQDVALTGGASLSPGVLSTVDALFYLFSAVVAITDIPAYQRRRKPNVGS
jgi:hypothetical protein